MMTFAGIEHLCRTAYGSDTEFLQFDMRRAEVEFDTYVPEYHWGNDVDLIILGGTPSVSDDPEALNLRLLEQAITRWPNAKVVGLGVGSFYRYSNLTRGVGDAEPHKVHRVGNSVAPFRDFDLLFVRDPFAKKVLEQFDIKSTLYNDMSTFSYFRLYHPKMDELKRDRNFLIYYDPVYEGAESHLPHMIWSVYRRYQLNWARENDAEILTISSADASSLEEHHMRGRYVTDLTWMAWAMAQAKKVLTPRVHQSILAKIMGCPEVGLMPVDSRYLTAHNIGIPIVQPSIQELRASGSLPMGDHRLQGTTSPGDKYLFPTDYEQVDFRRGKLKRGVYTKDMTKRLRGIL
jgi:hypothetical protein